MMRGGDDDGERRVGMILRGDDEKGRVWVRSY
jgi:hypothetical protein